MPHVHCTARVRVGNIQVEFFEVSGIGLKRVEPSLVRLFLEFQEIEFTQSDSPSGKRGSWLYRPQLDDLVVGMAPDHLLGDARVLREVDLPALVDGGGEEVSLPAKTSTILPLSPGAMIVELFLVGLDLDAAAKAELLIRPGLCLLAVELRAGLDIDPDPELVDDRRDVLAAFADRGRHVLVVDVDHGLGVADHLDIDESFGVPADLPLDLLLGEFPAGPLLGLLLCSAIRGLRRRPDRLGEEDRLADVLHLDLG